MSYTAVTDHENPPLTLVEASATAGDSAAQSLAASLLLLGNQQRDDLAGLAAVAAASGAGGFTEAAPVEDVETLEVPLVRPTGARYSHEQVRIELSDRCGLEAESSPHLAQGGPEPGEGEGGYAPGLGPSDYGELAEELCRQPRPDRLALFLEACLYHPEPLVGTAAAIAYLPLAADPLRLVPVLEEGLAHGEADVCELAATGLAQFAPDHPALARLAQGSAGAPEMGAGETSMLVHGTWAAGSSWWPPGGEFHDYLKTQVPRFADLYDQADRFGWSGGYSPAARSLGARDLLDWVEGHDEQGITLLGHSHGANVMMLASQLGLESEMMMFLACPVHRHVYWPDFDRVQRAVSVRVRLDLVILADGGGQRFRDPQIQEVVLPVWFSHSAARDPGTWQRHDVPGRVGF